MDIPPTSHTLRDGESLVLRSPKVEDAATLLAFRRAVLAESADNLNHFVGGIDAVSLDDQRAGIQRAADAANTFFLTAFADDTAVGNISLHPEASPRLAHVATIGMGCLKRYHGRGLGTALLRTAIALAPQAGIWNLTLTVRTFNAAGIALYERCGFERVGTLRAIACVGDGYADEHLYQLILPRPTEAPSGRSLN